MGAIMRRARERRALRRDQRWRGRVDAGAYVAVLNPDMRVDG